MTYNVGERVHEDFIDLKGTDRIYDLLTMFQDGHQNGVPKYEEYDWNILDLWGAEHRRADGSIENCANVWRDLTRIASQVLKE